MTSREYEAHIQGDCNGGYGFIPCRVCVAEDSEVIEEEETEEEG